MMPHDLVVKNGMVIDGTGFSRYRADIAIKDGAILPWTWETFGEYMEAIDHGLGVNMMPLVGHNPLRLGAMGEAAWERAARADEIATMQRLLSASLEAGAWGWSTTASPTHAGPSGEPVPTRLADNDERLALARTQGEFNRGVIEILPRSVARPDEADRQHLLEVARTSGRPVFFLGFDADARGYVEAAAREGAQLYNLLRAIPFNPRFTLKKTTFFKNLDGWDVVMRGLAVEENLDTELQLRTRSAEEEAALAEMVKSGHALPSQSDAGAHLNTNFCTAGESSYVLGQWVRERQLLSLEDAIRRLTFQPARIMGLHDRGLVREGLAADLMVFDLARIGVKEDEVSNDGPAGAPRRVQRADGVHHVIGAGQGVLDHGRHTGALPGPVPRAARPGA